VSQVNKKSELMKKVFDLYVDSLTEGGKKCPSVDAMREIVILDDIKQSLSQSKKTDGDPNSL
jgi:hypothetical protein